MKPGLNAPKFSTPAKPRGRKRVSLIGGALLPRLRTLALFLALTVPLALGACPALADTYKVLTGVPEYEWYKGCSPTSGGMLMGYWFNQGYKKLLPGVTDAYDQAQVNNAISSPQHNKYVTKDYTYYDTYVGHTANSIADFMQTVSGGTYADKIPTGLKDWSASVGVSATASHNWVKGMGGTFVYANYQAEINAGHPMLLNLESYIPFSGWVGHTVVGYGYKDAMFQLTIPTGQYSTTTVTVPGFAVMDTWENGVGAGKQSGWIDWDGNPLYSLYFQGLEWWPFLDMTQTNGWDYTNSWDWQVVDGVFYAPLSPTPVPATLLLFACGLAVLVVYRRRPAI